MYRQSEKNLLSNNTFSTRPDNMVNFGPLAAEIGSGVWGTPIHFNGFCVLFILSFSSPILSGRRLDLGLYSSSTHDVALVGI